VPIVYKSGSFYLLDPSRPRRPVSGLLYLLTLYITRLSQNIAQVSKNLSCVQEVIGSKTVAKLQENITTIEGYYVLRVEHMM
jgi:hypothetical protein